ncbi:MAG TPA: hypothetical protein VER32_05655 [Pyrinomonadaceae bacterium]|nr:hypothetical protein [Pyrinomonadaceae bacterium]
MSADASETKTAAGATPTAKEAPTEQQASRPGVPKRFAPGQTVCNEKNEKGKLCNGHLKQMQTAHPSDTHLRGDDALHKCQTCGALYAGPPQGHVRDSRKQKRFVERDLAAILRAAGGTLPAYNYPNPKLPENTDALTSARPDKDVKASASESKRVMPTVQSATTRNVAATPDATQGAPAADSSPEADRHRPAAEAQAATGQASAAPMSPAAATASPAAGAETPSDLAPEASTELTPGAPKDERADKQ